MLRARKPVMQNAVLPENNMEEMQKDVRGFNEIAQILKGLTGIHLAETDKNLFLMAGRLNKVFRKKGISNYKEFISILKSKDPEAMEELVSAMTTNTTEFFREDDHFALLKTITKEILSRKGPGSELRVWCSASSTGQEAYTIAMVLEEERATLPRFNLKLLATDIDHEVIQKASNGIYTQNEINSAPPHFRQKYFKPHSNGETVTYQVSSQLRDSIRFAQLNLLSETYPFKYPFDIIFCRNVLIYFERETSEIVINKFAKALGKDGYLFLGHSETGMMKSPSLKPVGGALYQRKI